MIDGKPKDNRLQVRFPSPLRQRLQRFVDKAGLSKAATIKTALNDFLHERGY